MMGTKIKEKTKEESFSAIFNDLKGILTPYADQMVVAQDAPEAYSLDTTKFVKPNQRVFFGAAKIQKRYVSFYLMPVYAHPELLNQISDELRQRMQGKSCFNFTKPDMSLLAELKELTARGYAAYQQRGWV